MGLNTFNIITGCFIFITYFIVDLIVNNIVLRRTTTCLYYFINLILFINHFFNYLIDLLLTFKLFFIFYLINHLLVIKYVYHISAFTVFFCENICLLYKNFLLYFSGHCE